MKRNEHFVDMLLEHAEDMQDGLTTKSRLEVLNIGVDENSDQITSSLVDAISEPGYEQPESYEKSQVLPARQFPDAFHNAMEKHRKGHDGNEAAE